MLVTAAAVNCSVRALPTHNLPTPQPLHRTVINSSYPVTLGEVHGVFDGSYLMVASTLVLLTKAPITTPPNWFPLMRLCAMTVKVVSSSVITVKKASHDSW